MVEYLFFIFKGENMGKWMNRLLAPSGGQDLADHVATEDIARLVDATVGDAEREHLLRHINRCQRCYDILHYTIGENPFDAAERAGAKPWWKRPTFYAIAASIALFFIISGQLVYRHWSREPGIVTATLELDQNLIDILLDDSALQISRGARLDRLLDALQQRGVPVKTVNLAVLAKPYYQKKSLFGPKEFLHIRIEARVAYLEVRESQ
jgi:hypothetical protein